MAIFWKKEKEMKQYYKYITCKAFKKWLMGKALNTDKRKLLTALQRTFHLETTGIMDERTFVRLTRVKDKEVDAIKQLTKKNLAAIN